MPHDSHTTHEPDRVAREGDEIALCAGFEDEVHRHPTLLMFGAFAAQEREPAPLII